MGCKTLELVVGVLAALSFVIAQDSVSYDIDDYGKDDPNGTPFQTYLSNAEVKPPQMQINSNQTGLAKGFVFIGVDGEPTSAQNFPAIYDMSEERMGTLIWTGNYTEPFDFKVQTYKGKPVLTFWSGTLLNGYGRGSFYVLDQSYAEIAHFSPVGFGDDMGDMHEFTITSDDTALVAVYHAKQADLSSVDGSEDGWIFENTVQEINIESGEVVFQWNATDHVGFDESYNSLSDVGTEASPWDFFHINSIEKDADGDFLVSARVMDCIYKISGQDGSIIWRLNGKQSDFDVEDKAQFAFQHDARWVDDKEQNRITLFDNGPTDDIGYSRGLLLDVDQDAMTVKLITEFTNGAKTFAQFEGSLQAIDPSDENTNYMLGFGNQPFFTELDKDGNILLDVQFGKTNVVNSYRAYKLPWQGKPSTKPDMHYDSDENKAYFSWNGATDIDRWIVYTANTSNSSTWTNVTFTTRTGFETEIDLSDIKLNTYVRGKAINSTGGKLGWTRASDGENFFDAPDDVAEDSFETTSSMSSTTSSMISSTTPTPSSPAASSTNQSPASSTTGAAPRVTQGVMEQVYVAAVVVVGGLAFV